MADKRLRDKMFQVWLHSKEFEFLKTYSEKNMMTASETIRGWLHEVMKMEGHKITEPRNPEEILRK